MALSPKQQRFAAEYTVDFNATAAAIRAGYSKKTAAQQGYNLLQMREIQEAIKGEFDGRQKRTHIDGDMVVGELAKIAFANGADFAKVVKEGSFPSIDAVPTDQLSKDKQAAIAGYKTTQYGVEIKLHDKVKALELLGKHLGLFTEKISIAAIDPETVKEVEALIHDAEAGD